MRVIIPKTRAKFQKNRLGTFWEKVEHPDIRRVIIYRLAASPSQTGTPPGGFHCCCSSATTKCPWKTGFLPGGYLYWCSDNTACPWQDSKDKWIFPHLPIINLWGPPLLQFGHYCVPVASKYSVGGYILVCTFIIQHARGKLVVPSARRKLIFCLGVPLLVLS